MKKFLLLLTLPLVLLLFNSFIRATQLITIKGRVMQTSDYCGGAEPGPEQLKRMNSPAPVPQFKLFIKRGTVNSSKAKVYKTVTTDANGNFEVQLPPGNYVFVEESKSKPFVAPKNNATTEWNVNCLRENYAKPDYLLKVSGERKDTITINYHRYCSYAQPCMNYHGSLPPSAEPKGDHFPKDGGF